MDFTLTRYKHLLQSLVSTGHVFKIFEDYLSDGVGNDSVKLVILRHDVDRIPRNALKTAIIENEFGIKGSYYFRILPCSYDEVIIEKILSLGHEVGYHYEDVDLVFANYKLKIINDKDRESLIDKAYESFCGNLEMMRKEFDIKTICMHGSPRSEYDNKIIWEKYDYKELGIIGEPYFDIDFEEFAYFTDTGRCWNGNNISVRDKVESKRFAELNNKFKTTQQIIDNIDMLPEKVMFTIHPERWTDNPVLWVRQYVYQNLKNVVKRIWVK